jgi:hypothetical protein
MLSLALMGSLPPGARVTGEAALAVGGTSKNLTVQSERKWRDVRGGEIAMVSRGTPIRGSSWPPFRRCRPGEPQNSFARATCVGIRVLS